MNTINTIKATNNLTEKEIEVIDFLSKELEPWIGVEDYSPIEVSDIAQGTSQSINSVKGIVGSLCKKQILSTWRDESMDLISFLDQCLMIK